MFAICVGNVHDGFNIYLDDNGLAFSSFDKAVARAEECFPDWHVIELYRTSDI